MAQHIIAIDLSNTVARMVILEATFRRAALQKALTVELDPDMAPVDVWNRIRE